VTDSDLDKLTDFIIEHLKYKDREQIKRYIKDHEKYGTIDYATDEMGNIIGVCRWNMSDDGTIGQILDLAVADGWRKKGLGRDFVLRAIKRWTKVTHLEYQRGLLGDKEWRRLPIKSILERGVF
jgi:N-acetylglutamate synthase-like GNAT family acetyltransferase